MIGPEFSVSSGEHGSWAVVSVAGELDMSTSPRLSAALDETGARSSRVLVDLSEVTFLDSAALGLLIAARNSLAASGGELGLIVSTTPVRRVLEITGLLSAFDVHETLSAVAP